MNLSDQTAAGRRGPVTTALGLLLALALTITALTAPPASSATSGSTVRAAAAAEEPDISGFPERCDRGVLRACRITYYADRPFLVLWGDSHALEYRSPIEFLARNRKVNLVVIFKGGCPLSLPLPASSGEPRAFCDRHNQAALDYVRHLQKTGRGVRLVLNSWWHYYRVRYAKIVREKRTGVDAGYSVYARHIATLGAAGSRAMFQALGRSGIHADVIGQSGTVPSNAPPCDEGEEPYVCDLPRTAVLPNASSNASWLRSRADELAHTARMIDTSSAYCDDTTCYGRVWGNNTFFDQPHLGKGLTDRMRRFFVPTFDALLRQR